MTPEQQQQQPNPLQERIERDVRMLIGDLQMQLIVTRALLEQSQQAIQQQQARPPAPKPNGSAQPETRL